MAQGGSNKKVANSLVSASCAAVLAVYSAGYMRTQAAADRFSARTVERRVPSPDSPRIRVAAVNNDSHKEESQPAAPKVPAEAHALAPVSSPDSKDPAVHQPIESAEDKQKSFVAQNTWTDRSPAEVTPAPAPVVASTSPEPKPTPAAAPAPAAVPEPKVEQAATTATPAVTVWKDGTYVGMGYSRHGEIEATVVIAGGRIKSAVISHCYTRYSCDVIDTLIPQPAQRQSADVDNVSGATQSADAFSGAVAEALTKAK